MAIEIEAKLKVDSLEVIAERLTGLGAVFLGEQDQRDIYFDDADGSLKGSDKCLRIREQVCGGEKRIFLTFKGAKEKDDFKKREEIDTEVFDGGAIEQLLGKLGMKKTLVCQKKRMAWRYNSCEIGLDELPLLGSFVEIEGADDKVISQVQKSLGLSDAAHVCESYADMISEKL